MSHLEEQRVIRNTISFLCMRLRSSKRRDGTSVDCMFNVNLQVYSSHRSRIAINVEIML